MSVCAHLNLVVARVLVGNKTVISLFRLSKLLDISLSFFMTEFIFPRQMRSDCNSLYSHTIWVL